MADYLYIIWDEDDDENGNVAHIAEHGVTANDAEHVLENPTNSDFSHSSGLPCDFGYTPDGQYIIVIYQHIDEDTILPITAFEVDEP